MHPTSRSPHANRRLILLGHFLCFGGFGIWAVSVPLHLLRVSATADLAIYSACLGLCAVLGIPLLSPVVDRLPRRTVLLLATVALIGGACARWGASLAGMLTLPVLVAIDGPTALAFGILQPALQAVLSSLCEAREAGALMARQRLAEGLARMVAPAAGGALFASFGGPTAFLAVTMAFTLAAASFSLIRTTEAAPPVARTLPSWWADIVAGLRVKVRIPAEMSQTVASLFVGAATAPLMGVALPALLQGQHAPDALGYAQASFGLGGVAGFWLLRPALARRLNDRQLVVATLLTCAASCGVMRANLPLVLGLCAAIGCAMATMLVAMQTNRMLATPTWYRGRLAALNVVLAQLGSVLGAGLAGAAQGSFGPRAPFLVSAGLLAATAVWVLLDHAHFGVLAAEPQAAEGLYERSHPALFQQSATSGR